ncbi:MAG TPA: hypothetical protein VMO47_16230 [Rhodothermales bacterium]|nr:hypothetical protein [Rhodothermales bacterium]
MSDSVVDHRQRVLLFLKLLASTEATERLVGSAEPEEIADRLCNLWIDELFVPGLRYRDGLKGDRSASSVRDFEAQFSTSEIALLEQFHRFLELRLEMLPKRRAEETTFPRGDFWQSIIAHAGRVLEEIDPEGLEMDAIVDKSADIWRLAAPDNHRPGWKR